MLIFIACQNPQKDTSVPAPEQSFPEFVQLTELIKENPNDATLYLERAKMYVYHEMLTNAVADLEKSISIDSNLIESWHILADCYLDQFNSGQALATMEKAAFQFPQNVQTLLKLAEFQVILKKPKDALQTLQTAEKLTPLNAEVFFMRGFTLKETGDTILAIQQLQKAVSLDPELTDGWLLLGDLKAGKNDPEAPKYYRAILERDPENVTALFALGSYWQQSGKLDQASENYRQIILLDQNHTDSYFNLGLILLEKDSTIKAYNHFNIVANLDPYYTKAYLYRALSQELLGNWEAAKKDYDTALKLEPDNLRAQEGIARVIKLENQ